MTCRLPPAAALLAGALLLSAWLGVPRAATAQVRRTQAAHWKLGARLLATYGGSWSSLQQRLAESHVLTEGLELNVSGWVWQSRFMTVDGAVQALRLDGFGDARSTGNTYGYRAEVGLFPRSVLPLFVGATRAVSLAGTTPGGTQTLVSTIAHAGARLASPWLPRVEVRSQRRWTETTAGERYETDNLDASVAAVTQLHRFSGLARWTAQEPQGGPRTGSLVLGLTDEFYPLRDTTGSVNASLTQGQVWGDAARAGFTGYQASANLTSRTSARTLVQGRYALIASSSDLRDDATNSASVASTVDLMPTPVLLGTALSWGLSTLDADGGRRSLQNVALSQGALLQLRRPRWAGTLGGSVQGGWASASDGRDGLLYGWGLNGSAEVAPLGVPTRLAAEWRALEDPTGLQTLRRLDATLQAVVARLRPWLLQPLAAVVREQRPARAGAGPLTGTTSFNALLLGNALLRPGTLSLSAGYSDVRADDSPVRARRLAGQAGFALSLGAKTFANFSGSVGHTLGGPWSGVAMASLTWRFRLSSLTANYVFSRSWPDDGAARHAVTAYFTRTLSTSFLEERP